MLYSKIIGTGSYAPEKIVTNDDLSKIVDTSDEWIYTRTGIKSRRIADKEKTYDMGVKAAKKALEDGNVKAEEIDMIIVATISGEYSTPSIACIIQKELNAINAMCFDISAACTGFIYGLDIVNQFIKNGSIKKALVIGTEKISQLLNWNDRNTCILFGDAAGAVDVSLSNEEGIIDIMNKSDGSNYDYLHSKIRHNDTPFYVQDKDHYMQMVGGEIFQFACTKVPQNINDLISNNNEDIENIDYFVLHQANKRIVNTICKKLKQNSDKFYMNIEEYGNTSSASIPVALDKMNKEGLLEGKKVIMSGFGAGLTYGSALIQF
jgi:3-oxoacyl-[acyl-carrier-protein] synthase-3